MSNLTVDERDAILVFIAAVESKLNSAWNSEQDLRRILELDDRDETNIATKAAVRAAAIRIRGECLAVADYIQSQSGTLPP